MHFIIHGIHHDHPNDKLRLVMPPAVSIPLAALFFFAFTLIFGTPAAYPLFGGFIAGYLVYDYTHYYVHHFVPKSRARQAAARAAHAPPLPGPPLRLRRLLAALGRRLPHPAADPPPLAGGCPQRHLELEPGVRVVELLAEELAQPVDPVADGLRVEVERPAIATELP